MPSPRKLGDGNPTASQARRWGRARWFAHASAASPSSTARSGFWAELSGALAVGLSALALVVLVFQILAWAQGTPGPGLLTVGGHLLAAGLAVLVQRFADRRHGWPGALAVLGVLLVTAVTLWIFWWA